MNKIVRAAVIFLCVVMITFSESHAQLKVGDDAPDFILKDLDDIEVSLSDFENKAVLLIFFGYSCPFCIRSAPYVEAGIWEIYQRAEFQVLGIDQWDGARNDIITFFKNPTNVTYPLLQKGSDVAKDYGVSYDWFVLIDKEHKIAYTASGTLHNSGKTEQSIVQDVEAKVREVLDDVTSVETEQISSVPGEFSLAQNYPNPFNPATTISFSISVPSTVKLTIFNIVGAQVMELVNSRMGAGQFQLDWNGKDSNNRQVSSGVYFYKLQVAGAGGNSFEKTKRMLLIK